MAHAQTAQESVDRLLRQYDSSPSLLQILVESEGALPNDLALDSDKRKVTSNDGTPYINPTSYGTRTLSIEVGDEVEVSTFPDALVIWRPK